MKGQYALLRILIAGFLLYVAWPFIPQSVTSIEQLFWGSWLFLFLLVIGANSASVLQIIQPPIMEQKREKQRKTYNH